MNGTKPNNHFIIFCLFGFYLSFFAGYQGGFAQYFKFSDGQKQQTIAFKLIRNLVVIPIYINEKGPFNFILDTGVNPMIVIDSTLMDRLKVAYSRNIKISGYGNFESVNAHLGSTDVKVGNAEMKNVPTVFLAENTLPLSGYVGQKIHGLLGYSFFSSFWIKVDYDNKRLKFCTYQKKIPTYKWEKIPFELIENKPYIDIQVQQENLPTLSLKTLLDCGANHAISLETLNNIQFPAPSFTIAANLGIGLTGEIKGKVGRISSLKIGRFQFSEVLSSYPIYHIDSVMNRGRNANMGAEVLSRFNAIYDYQHQAILLKKNNRFRRPFDYDMSGLELYAEEGPPSKILISRIEANSPAQLIALQVGDEITGINFKNIDDFTLDEIGDIFKAKNGYNVLLEIWRNKTFMIKLLKLKKRI